MKIDVTTLSREKLEELANIVLNEGGLTPLIKEAIITAAQKKKLTLLGVDKLL